jgi:DnaK suppressor protein
MHPTKHADSDAERARHALERRRKALLAGEDERNYDLLPAQAPASRDPLEREEQSEAARALGILSRDTQRELLDIEAALERIANGRWGLCDVCGHAIGHQLLRSSPERSLCLTCELE